MSGKKWLSVVLVLTLIVTAGMFGYSWKQSSAAENKFKHSGYVLSASPEDENKQKKFPADATWKQDIEKDVVFKDIQGEDVKVPQESFAHYDNEDLVAFSKGVVVDTHDVESLQVTNHYAITPDLVFASNNGSYVIENTDLDKEFMDFIWKVKENKYMLVSPSMSVGFSEEDVRDVEKYVEVTYIDNGIIQLQTAENIWQTISENCIVTLENGKEVNLSLKNIADETGNVLMDFSKMVIDANDNIEVIPLTDELKELKEDTIPRFDITAENGQAGTPGTSGANGEAGEAGDTGEAGEIGDDGNQGEDGDEGDAGSAGTSGQNGKAGAPGAAGSNGAPGGSENVEGEVLNFPIFTLKDWAVSGTSASGTIMVEDEGAMLLQNQGELSSKVYVIDNSNNEIVKTHTPAFEFSNLDSSGYAFEFTNLKPDKQYRLVIDAPINTGLDNANDYMRNFINKIFWTDSTGVYMELAKSTTADVVIGVKLKDYANSSIKSATVYLYGNKTAAESASQGNLGTGYDLSNVEFNVGSGKANFGNLTSNSSYYARVVTKTDDGVELMTDQILTVETLKKRATIGTPTLVANKDSWGFEASPGTVHDPDSGIFNFSYEFYNSGDIGADGSIKSGAKPVKIVSASSSQSIIVPIDGMNLAENRDYKIRVVASFDDNEKTMQLTSSFSNSASVTGSKLPVVYFVNEGSGSTGNPSNPTEESLWYDQIYGNLIVAPGTEGGKLVIDKTHQPVVTVRAAGYYYAQYPVYLKADAPNDGSSYLEATVNSGGFVEISVPNKALTSKMVTTEGAVNGLRPKTQYSLIVTGDLSKDGTNVTDPDIQIGSAIVSTPDKVGIKATWVDDHATATIFETNLKFASPTSDGKVEGYFNRQMNTLTSLSLSLIEGGKSNPGKELGKITVTDDNFKTVFTDSTVDSLGAAFKEGIDITEKTLNIKESDLSGQGIVHLKVSAIYDYTIKAENRLNQKEYQLEDDTTLPPAGGNTGAIYINEFKVVGEGEDAHDIKLRAAPDPIPEKELGFAEVKKNSDGSYTLVPNYKNTSKLAQKMTFFAFDYPDFHKKVAEFDTTQWKVDDSQYKVNTQNITLGATTAVDRITGIGTWLGKVSVNIPSTGKIPNIRFYPKSVDNYYNEKYKDPSQVAAAIKDYQPGKTTDASTGEYIFFYNDINKDQPEKGHQFVFAWNMEFKYEDENTNKYYPFDIVSGGCEYDIIPHSGAQDSPFTAIDVKALPWKVDIANNKGTWAIHINDKDGAVQKESNGKATLYKRTSALTATTINTNNISGTTAQANVYNAAAQNIEELIGTSNANLVEIYETKGSVPGAVKVQWYTNKYTTGQKGIFPDGSYLQSTIDKSVKATTDAGSRVIPYYESAFTWYNEDIKFETPKVEGTKVELSETTSGLGSDSVVKYRVTLKTPIEQLKNVSGYRFTFTGSSKTVTTDKYLSGIDNATTQISDKEGRIDFDISLSRELGDVAGQTIALSVKPLYETGQEGFGYNDLVSLKNYSIMANVGVGQVQNPYGYTVFGNSGKLQSIGAYNNSFVQIGSFFNLKNLGLNSVTADSTRHNDFTQRSEQMGIQITSRGVLSGNYAMIPRELGIGTNLSTIVVKDKNGTILNKDSMVVPNITPVINYTKSAAGANSIESEFAVTGLPVNGKNSGTWFLLEKKSLDGNWIVQKKDSGIWTEVSGANTTNPEASYMENNKLTPSKFAFTGLESDKNFRVTAYYYDSTENKFKKMNMLNISGDPQQNYLELTTSKEPLVKLNVAYETTRYITKRLKVDANVSNALEFYYTVELEEQSPDGNWQHLTYLDLGDSQKAVDKYTDVYQLGSDSSGSGIDTNKQLDMGFVYKQTITDGNLKRENEEPIGLEFGKEYKVRVRVYNNNTGPKIGESIDKGDLIGTEEGKAKAASLFKVANKKDETHLNGSFSLLNGESTISFTPTYIRKSSTIRKDYYTAIVIRSRVDSDGNIVKDDVTQYVSHSLNEKVDVSKDPIYLPSAHKLIIQAKEGFEIQDGDQFTCYTYAIQDDVDMTNTKGVIGNPRRDDIIQGRSLENDDLEAASIEMDRGESIFLNKAEVSYKSQQTSAGAINVTKAVNSNKFKVTMEQPINLGGISHVAWTVTTNYIKEDGNITSESVSSSYNGNIYEPLSLIDLGNSQYEFELNPSFSELANSSKVWTYAVTLQFYKESSEGIFESRDILMTAANSNGIVESGADEGLRFSTTIVMDETLAPTLLMPDMALPPLLENQIPPVDIENPDIIPPEIGEGEELPPKDEIENPIPDEDVEGENPDEDGLPPKEEVESPATDEGVEGENPGEDGLPPKDEVEKPIPDEVIPPKQDDDENLSPNLENNIENPSLEEEKSSGDGESINEESPKITIT